jgi:hypothetical protein
MNWLINIKIELGGRWAKFPKLPKLKLTMLFVGLLNLNTLEVFDKGCVIISPETGSSVPRLIHVKAKCDYPDRFEILTKLEAHDGSVYANRMERGLNDQYELFPYTVGSIDDEGKKFMLCIIAVPVEIVNDLNEKNGNTKDLIEAGEELDCIEIWREVN